MTIRYIFTNGEILEPNPGQSGEQFAAQVAEKLCYTDISEVKIIEIN